MRQNKARALHNMLVVYLEGYKLQGEVTASTNVIGRASAKGQGGGGEGWVRYILFEFSIYSYRRPSLSNGKGNNNDDDVATTIITTTAAAITSTTASTITNTTAAAITNSTAAATTSITAATITSTTVTAASADARSNNDKQKTNRYICK